ncbi:hypothetical protein [uncultured Idiomarina sp.]|uniref:hypothetical protein n=1 Tax=uncultured Idiomarina sp. TaxID=352961 RepID=UPI0025948122|nr:hypothetical protein [uncultured Idiomarina sp.]
MSNNKNDEQNASPIEVQSVKHEASKTAGRIAAAMNFFMLFLQKPWHRVLPLVKYKNRKKVFAYLLLLLSAMFPAITTIWGRDIYLFSGLQGFWGFIFVASAVLATIAFATGTSAFIARHASKAVLGMILFVIGQYLWELFKFIQDAMELCGRSCGDFFDSAFFDSGAADVILETFNIGFFLFIAAFLLLFPCAFGKQFRVNEALVAKLKELNALEVNAKRFTDHDIQNGINKANAKSKILLRDGAAKVTNIDLATTKDSLSKTASYVRSGDALASIKAAPKRKVMLVVGGLIFVVWLVSPSAPVKGPTLSEVEQLFKAQPEFRQIEQAAYLGQMFGQGGEPKLVIEKVENCESYIFDNDAAGVACEVTLTFGIGQEIERHHETSLFFYNAAGRWEYRGAD